MLGRSGSAFKKGGSITFGNYSLQHASAMLGRSPCRKEGLALPAMMAWESGSSKDNSLYLTRRIRQQLKTERYPRPFYVMM
ncbi:unnamed protein product [Caretta caretta]